MDIDDDRSLSIDCSDVRRLKTFKVPKKSLSAKSSFDKLSLDSSDFKDNIYSKILSGFKNPNSNSSLKVLSAYNIYNVEVESVFNKKKQYFKKEYSVQSAVEYFGFIYISNLSELRKIVQCGRIKNGNLSESVLGQAEMGVSVSQFADIFHPCDNKNCPKSGFLLLVKYLRGRVCFVVEDNNPMEPQPNYDCHMSKSYNHESFPSVGRAFHTTQVYLYEYSDDLDLIEEPSHVMPWAAIEFVWTGPFLYKLVSVPIVVTKDANGLLIKDPALKNADKRARLLARTSGIPTLRIKQAYMDCNPILCTQLQLKLSNSKDETTHTVVLDIPITILSYHTSWRLFPPLYITSWQICELIEWMSFEQEFLKPLIKNHLNENFCINDVFNKRITINRNIENTITSLVDTTDTQFVNYLRLVVNDPSRDRAKMARLIDHFLETKTVGRIKLFDSSSSMIFVFPDSTLSQNFGIPSIKTLDVNYLHIILITNKSLNSCQSSQIIDEVFELELKTNTLELSNSQSNCTSEELLPMFILKQSLKSQNHVQKSKLREMCGLVSNGPLLFTDINFEYVESITNSVTVIEKEIIAEDPDNKIDNKIKENDEDRPYDPSENMMALSDSVNNVKNSKINQIRKQENDFKEEEPPIKLLKREDKKIDLNIKLLQLFAKIESPVEHQIELTPGEMKIDECQREEYFQETIMEDDYHYQYHRKPDTTIFSLDRNKFAQTSFRHGVSVYVPQLTPTEQEDVNPPRDRDLRFHNANTNPFDYSDVAMRYNGVNR